jgi:hypothetical protein
VPFTTVVGVYDANGDPLQGKHVMAEITLFGTRWWTADRSRASRQMSALLTL